MAWVLRARGGVASIEFGAQVRYGDWGIFEGTWIGEGDATGPLRSRMALGSGVFAWDESLIIVPPGHTLEGVYLCRLSDELVASNSLVGLLVAANLELDPRVAYPPLFNESVAGVLHTVIPTRTAPVEAHCHDHVRVGLDGTTAVVPKELEAPFTSFVDYRARLSAALASAISNASSSRPAVTISSGYDGAAVAVLAAELGCSDALTITEGKPVRGSASLKDSGVDVGRKLGLNVAEVERLAYRGRNDLAEAEFLATGFSGEDVVMSGMESHLYRDGMLISAFFGDGMWWMHRPPRPTLWRSDQSGSSLGEWRLRTGFIHVPLPYLGAERQREIQALSRSPEMLAWVLGRSYDKPIPRRILEEAGAPRGTFGEVKRAASATIHVDGPSALAPATEESLTEFAAREGVRTGFRRRALPIWRRGLLKATRKVGAESIAWQVEQAKIRLGVLEPEFGSLLLRWAVSVVRPRYESVARR